MWGRVFTLVAAAAFSGSADAQEFNTAREARAEAAKHLKSKDYAKSQQPLEAALALTPEADRKERVEIYRALLPAYRLLPDIDKMQEAVEYIETNGDSAIERKMVGRDFGNFLKQRGKTEWAATHYEALLKTDPKSPAALVVLSTIYADGTDEKQARGSKLEGELKSLDRERAVQKAESLEKGAEGDPTTAASAWKDAAKSWLEAGDKVRAKAAVVKSKQAFPEKRSPLLGMYWHEGLGDILMQLDEPGTAALHYEEAIGLASSAPLKNPLRTKLAKAKAKSETTIPKP